MNVSILVPAHNEAANIQGVLQSLLDQRTQLGRIVEIIVVASGCTDDTAALARKASRGQAGYLGIGASRSACRRLHSTDSCSRTTGSACIVWFLVRFLQDSYSVLMFGQILVAGRFNPDGVSIAAKLIISAVSCTRHQTDIEPILRPVL